MIGVYIGIDKQIRSACGRACDICSQAGASTCDSRQCKNAEHSNGTGIIWCKAPRNSLMHGYRGATGSPVLLVPDEDVLVEEKPSAVVGGLGSV